MAASAGRVLLIPKGTYNVATTYNMLDVVYYNGGSYVCKQTSLNNLPTDTDYWQLLVSSSGTAAQVSFDPIGTDMVSTNVQDAVVEVNGKVATKAERTDITSIIATGATNTTGAQIPNGAYFYLNGVLCRAIADIATSATFTLNTNYEEVTVGSQITTLNSNLSVNNVTISGWSNQSWVKKQGKHVFGFLSKSVSASITNGRNYSFGLSLPSDIRPQNNTLLSGYAFVGSNYVPATFVTDNSGNIVVIVGSPYNNQTVTDIYIKVDLYIA